jgi:hypothetical protein
MVGMVCPALKVNADCRAKMVIRDWMVAPANPDRQEISVLLVLWDHRGNGVFAESPVYKVRGAFRVNADRKVRGARRATPDPGAKGENRENLV